MLMLISPYTSIKGLVKQYAGSFGSFFIKDHFNNLKNIKNVECPILIIHGEKDRIIPFD